MFKEAVGGLAWTWIVVVLQDTYLAGEAELHTMGWVLYKNGGIWGTNVFLANMTILASWVFLLNWLIWED